MGGFRITCALALVLCPGLLWALDVTIVPFRTSRSESVEAVVRENLDRASVDLASAGLSLAVQYSRSKSGNLNLYGQIYDGSRLIDALSISEDLLEQENLALPADEMKASDADTSLQFAQRVVIRIKTNPRRLERTENIQESFLALPPGKDFRLPERRADQDVFRLLEDQKVVSATRLATRVRDAPAAVYVISHDQIRERGYRTLSDALHDIPGFDIIHTSGIFPELIHQRGLVGNNQRTLVYVDGILDNNITEQAALAGTLRFPLFNVERIEIISGPASALYGANAFNGVINIITRDGQTSPGGGVEARGGWHEANGKKPGGSAAIAQRGLLRGEDTTFAYSASIYYMRTSGADFSDVQRLDKKGASPYDAAYFVEQEACGGTCSPGSTSVGSWWSPYFNAAWEDTYNITGKFSAGGFRFESVNWQYLQGDGTFANGTQQVDTDLIPGYTNSSWDFRNNSVAMGYLWEISSKVSLDSEVVMRHTEILSSSHEQTPNLTGPYWTYLPGDATTSKDYARPDYSYDVQERLVWLQSDRSNLTAGIESTYTVVPSAYGSEKRFTYVNNAAYLQQIFSPWSWFSLTGGYRYDFSTIYGASNTPRLGAVFTPVRDLSIKILASSGFRAPTAWELFNGTKQRKSNPDLRPEYLRSYEAGIGYRFLKKYYVSVQQYYSRITNLLLEVETAEPNLTQPGTNWNQNQNVGKAAIYGTEFEADLQFHRTLGVFLNYTHNQGKYDGLSYSLTSSPSTKGRPGDDLFFDAAAAAIKTYTGRTIVPISGSIPNIAPHRANAGMTWRPIPRVSIYLGANYVDIRRTVATNPEKTVKGYTQGSLNLRVDDLFTPGLYAALTVRNAGDDRFFDPGIRSATGSYYPTRHPLETRNIWITAGYRW